MEIQKIFSDEYDDERLYSVLMSEEELSLFSEVKDRAVSGTTGLIVGGAAGEGFRRLIEDESLLDNIDYKLRHKVSHPVKSIEETDPKIAEKFTEEIKAIRSALKKKGFKSEQIEEIIEDRFPKLADAFTKHAKTLNNFSKKKGGKVALVATPAAIGLAVGASLPKKNKKK